MEGKVMQLVLREFKGEIPRTVPRETFVEWRLVGEFEDGREAVRTLSLNDPILSNPDLSNEGRDRFAIYEGKGDPPTFKFVEIVKAFTPEVSTSLRKQVRKDVA